MIALFFILGTGIASTSTVINNVGFFDSLWPALVGLMVMTFQLIRFQAFKHSEKIKKGAWPTHWKANIVRGVVLLAFTCLLHAYSFDRTKVALLFTFGLFWMGIVFNWSLNLFRGLHPFYVGKNDHKDALTDRMFSSFRYGGEMLFLTEGIGMIITGYYYLR